jgi:hypothetical protein
MHKAEASSGIHSAGVGIHCSSTYPVTDFTKKWLFCSTGRIGEV